MRCDWYQFQIPCGPCIIFSASLRANLLLASEQIYVVKLICIIAKTFNNADGHFNGLVQDCSNSIANALELLQSCTKPSIWFNMSDAMAAKSSQETFL